MKELFSDILPEALGQALAITALVALMMALIELANVLSGGRWFKGLGENRFSQVFLAAALGLIPGCAGGYAVVSMYTHGLLGFGALVAMMIATSGDEAFVMLAMFPRKALGIMALLFVIALAVGLLVDRLPRSFSPPVRTKPCPDGFALHDEDSSHGHHGGSGRHFLTEHLWHHVILRHVPGVFLWSFGTLLIVGILVRHVDISAWISGNIPLMIVLAALVGIIPESGPHLVFVTLFASGVLPAPVLIASCISQDGHAGLPLLSESTRAFLLGKGINLATALSAGFASMLFF